MRRRRERESTSGSRSRPRRLACAYYGIFAGFMVGYVALFLACARGLWRSRSVLDCARDRRSSCRCSSSHPRSRTTCSCRTKPGSADRWTMRGCTQPTWRSYLASAAHAHNWLLPIIKDWNHEVLFPGFLAIILAVVGVGDSGHGATASSAAARWRPRNARCSTAASACSPSGPPSARAPASTRCCSRRSRSSRCSGRPGAPGSSSRSILALFAALRRPRAAAPPDGRPRSHRRRLLRAPRSSS